MIKALLLSALLVSTGTLAETNMILSGGSKHLFEDTYTYHGETHDLNENNYGLGIQVDDVRFLVFENSYKKRSVALMWTPSILETNLHGVLGVTTGYEDTPKSTKFMPLIGVEYPIDVGDFQIVPGFYPPGLVTFHAQWGF